MSLRYGCMPIATRLAELGLKVGDRICIDEEAAMPALSRMTDQELDQRYEDLQTLLDAGDPDDAEYERISNRMLAIEREQDAREAWNSDDDRIRESVGNYVSRLGLQA